VSADLLVPPATETDIDRRDFRIWECGPAVAKRVELTVGNGEHTFLAQFSTFRLETGINM